MPAPLIRRLSTMLLVLTLTSGCIMTGLSRVDADPSFSWDTLKRDWILMTPLLDLRESREPAFFPPPEQAAYAERFKQEFYRLRKDIRVFGAGGAFEHMASIADLPALGRKVFAKEPLPDEARARILSGSQDLRFIFFFAVTAERVSREARYAFREDQEMDTITYESKRSLTVRMALWDSKDNKTVWIGTQHLTPSSSNSVDVRNPNKRREKRKADNAKGYKYVWVGRALSVSTEGELRANPGRFPAVPGREPSLSSTFDDFALGIPIHPSEENLIEYMWFTYHRPEARFGVAQIGTVPSVTLQLGTSSIIANRYRVGGALILPSSVEGRQWNGKAYTIDGFAFGASLDMEWELSDRLRLLTGAMLESYAFTLDPEEEPSAIEPEETLSDFTTFLWPRIQLLRGARRGFQWGAGVTYRLFYGIEEEALKIHRPSPWAVDLGVSYTFRGF